MSKFIINEKTGIVFPWTEALSKKPYHRVFRYEAPTLSDEEHIAKIEKLSRQELMKKASGYGIKEISTKKNSELVLEIFKYEKENEEADTASS